ncbi:hypothetical protein MVEN_00272300 [Mycena venus]|uniref:Uncharacterized protein n=1 Tax=Mycena venus TaxID=2733690 RepID=A0A8H7DCK6_9AGAR|nr:hypothetical protein MVEN_00272300 [Mycena venus]
MSCGVLNALYALARQWLMGPCTPSPPTASLLLSFESLVLVSFLTFLFLGSTLCVLVLWPIITERDDYDYDECERGLYYADSGDLGDGKWMGVAVPVILLDRNGRTNRILLPTSPQRKKDHHHGPHH